MRSILVVAGAVFRESVRDRVPYTMVIFAVLLMAASYLISQMTAGQDIKIIKDLGLAALSIFGLLIAVFLGIGLVSKEVERKSIYGLLTKPVTRAQFILGKYVGLVLTLTANLGVMTIAFYAVLAVMAAQATAPEIVPMVDPRLLIAIVLTIAELALVVALALFFSASSSAVLSTFLTLGFWVAGHYNADLRHFENVVESQPVILIARGLYYVLPNLAPFNVRAEVVHGIPVTASHVGLTLLYATVYSGILLTGAIAIFRRRDFK